MEYYTVEKKNNLGEQYIELSVFQAEDGIRDLLA